MAPPGRGFISTLVLVALLAIAPLLTADASSLSLTLHGHGQDCTDARFCFTIEEGNLTNLTPGTTVSLTFENHDTAIHNVYVAPLDQANPNRASTNPDHALATTQDLGPGQQDRITFTAPTNTTGLYFWCEVSSHEAHGMYLEAPYDPETWEPPEPHEAPYPLLQSLIKITLILLATGETRQTRKR